MKQKYNWYLFHLSVDFFLINCVCMIFFFGFQIASDSSVSINKTILHLFRDAVWSLKVIACIGLIGWFEMICHLCSRDTSYRKTLIKYQVHKCNPALIQAFCWVFSGINALGFFIQSATNMMPSF